jgi:hypothetical protein
MIDALLLPHHGLSAGKLRYHSTPSTYRDLSGRQSARHVFPARWAGLRNRRAFGPMDFIKSLAPRDTSAVFSLSGPGMVAWFSVYVVLITGNEAVTV